MNDNRTLFIEETIIGAVKRLLSGWVNKMLGEAQFSIPLVEFGGYSDGLTISPAIALSTCERSEKERIVWLDAYALTITWKKAETIYREDSQFE
jgi:hypothetical protein